MQHIPQGTGRDKDDPDRLKPASFSQSIVDEMTLRQWKAQFFQDAVCQTIDLFVGVGISVIFELQGAAMLTVVWSEYQFVYITRFTR